MCMLGSHISDNTIVTDLSYQIAFTLVYELFTQRMPSNILFKAYICEEILNKKGTTTPNIVFLTTRDI